MNTSFQYVNFEETFSNSTYLRNSNGGYVVSSIDSELLIGGMNGSPNGVFKTFVQTVPEPSTPLLALLGLSCLVISIRRRGCRLPVLTLNKAGFQNA